MSLTLTQLGAEFVRIVDDTTHKRGVAIAEADGVMFMCPVCYQKNKGSRGTHWVLCWRPRVDAPRPPGPGRWEMEGTGLVDLTLKAGSSSILLTSGCRAHFFVRNGKIELT